MVTRAKPERIGIIQLWIIPCLLLICNPCISSGISEDDGQIYYNFPNEMQRSYSLPGDRAYNGYGAKGYALTENKESLLYNSVVTLRGARVSEAGPEGETIYEWQVLEIKDRDGDMVFILGEHSPPEAPAARIVMGSGKYKGISGGGSIGWEAIKKWPDGSESRAFSLNWKIEENPTPPVALKPGPGDTEVRVIWAYRYPNELDDKYILPDNRRFDHHDEDGFLLTPENPMSPFHDKAMWASTSILFPPGGSFSSGMIYQWAMCEATDTDGDQIFMWVTGLPETGQIIEVVKGTGKYDGIRGAGGPGMVSTRPWPGKWPGGPEVNSWMMWWSYPDK